MKDLQSRDCILAVDTCSVLNIVVHLDCQNMQDVFLLNIRYYVSSVSYETPCLSFKRNKFRVQCHVLAMTTDLHKIKQRLLCVFCVVTVTV